MKLLKYRSMEGYEETIIADKVIRLSKSDVINENGTVLTLIHLINKEIIVTEDSIKTLSARLENDE
jgi:hypothetical protein